MRFSILIPTYNRSQKLLQCLSALEAQEYDQEKFEIIVIDDGSTDDTAEVVAGYQSKSRMALQYFSQRNQGQGVARNFGVQQAKGEIVLLLGDDIVPTPRLIKEHDRVHAFHPEKHAAVLGFITWHPKLPITPLMKFMEKGGAILGRFGGHQFAYDLLEGKRRADYRFFYTSNLSLKKSLLVRNPFDPWFAGYGWEDIELGYRLEKNEHLELYYEPQAIAYHDHMMDELAFAKRMRDIGRSAHRLQKKYPELGVLPSTKKKLLLELFAREPFINFFGKMHGELGYYLQSKKYFLEGVKEGYNGADNS